MVRNEFLNGFLNNLRTLHFAMFRPITPTQNIIYLQTSQRQVVVFLEQYWQLDKIVVCMCVCLRVRWIILYVSIK